MPDDGRGERVYSSHRDDPLHDGHAHDAFDLVVLLDHGGDVRAAVKDAAALRGLERGRSQAHEPGATEGHGESQDAPAADSGTWPKPHPLSVKVEPEAYPLDALPDTIRAAVDEVAGFVKAPIPAGDMKRAEAMLFGQAHALQAIFMNLSRRAANQQYLKQWEAYLRMGLKAQNQCRMTLETLATIKNPPIVYARQANVTTGPQQVNNGVAAPSQAREAETKPTHLSGEANELLPDARASGLASRVDPALEAVGEVDRTQDRRG